MIMTAALQDKLIASKALGKKLTSTIVFTKGGKSKKREQKSENAASSAPMFASRNKSPLENILPSKRQRQDHPGNNEHIHWTKLTLCEYCNQGVQSKVLQLKYVCEP